MTRDNKLKMLNKEEIILKNNYKSGLFVDNTDKVYYNNSEVQTLATIGKRIFIVCADKEVVIYELIDNNINKLIYEHNVNKSYHITHLINVIQYIKQCEYVCENNNGINLDWFDKIPKKVHTRVTNWGVKNRILSCNGTALGDMRLLVVDSGTLINVEEVHIKSGDRKPMFSCGSKIYNSKGKVLYQLNKNEKIIYRAVDDEDDFYEEDNVLKIGLLVRYLNKNIIVRRLNGQKICEVPVSENNVNALINNYTDEYDLSEIDLLGLDNPKAIERIMEGLQVSIYTDRQYFKGKGIITDVEIGSAYINVKDKNIKI